MSQTAKAQEPSMEEILASIRRIIADDDAGKPAKAPEPAQPAAAAPATPPPPAKPAAPPAPKPTPAAAANSQDEIDAMLAELDGPPKATPKPAAPSPVAPSATAQAAPAAEVLDLTEAMAAPAPARLATPSP